MNVSKDEQKRSMGDALDILSSYRRRLVLAYVSGEPEPVPISALATEVAAAKHDKPIVTVTDTEQERSKIRLHHADIPPLAAAGLVHYDSRQGTVAADDLPLDGDEWLEMPVVEALEAWNR